MDDHIDVLLYGLGAIGSFYAFILSRAPKVLVKSPADLQRTFDYIVCANKATDQDETAKALAPVVDQSKTSIVIAQNGVGNEVPFRTVFPHCTIITCAARPPRLLSTPPDTDDTQVWVGAIQPTPGHVKHTKSEDTQLGLYKDGTAPAGGSDDQAKLSRYAGLLEAGGTKFSVVSDMQVQRWEKVVWNAAWNTLTTLTMLDTQTWLGSSARATPLTRELMREMIDVARACGVALDYALVDRLMDRILAMPGIGSSMQTDCRNGKPMEVNVILGYPVRRARELGIKTPIIDTLHTLLLGVDLRLRNQSK
ncbi:putative ketopantoate reductase family [Diplodia seriata]|uniref:2-dehydropantoate 2-reductase n=1 Tax=Diplodia seriata TaxID=420778 RepID=A0A0G2G0R4_9PEZI|nr:putative ketopantoate reductase family [Diplodia seriata]